MESPGNAPVRLPVAGSGPDMRPHREEIPIRDDAQVEIQLGHMCNNRCVFCVSGQMTELRRAVPVELAPVLDALDRARARGASKVTFLGGEPTLQRAFLPALRHAVELGFTEVVIFTNGVKSARRSYVEEIVSLGRFVWRFSIQGGNQATHDAVTCKPGAFARLMEGVRHLRELGQDVTANACINTLSFASAPDYVDLVLDHGIRQLHLDMVRPSDAGERTDEHLRSIMAPYSEMAPHFDRMLRRFHAHDPTFDVNLGNFPYCLLPQWAHKIHHDGEETATVSADGGSALSQEWNKYEDKRFDKQHPAGCEGCLFRPRCNGIFHKYLEFHGDDEFRAVTPEALRRADPDQKAFVHHLAPTLARLRGQLPTGWSLEQESSDERRRRVELWLRRGPVTVRLQLTPAEAVAPADAVLATDRFVLRAGVEPATARGRAGSVLQWVVAQLRREPGVKVLTASPPPALPPIPDLTVPEHGSRTGRAVLSRALARLVRELLALPDLADGDGEDQRQWQVFRRGLQQLRTDDPGALASLARWPTTATRARCMRAAPLAEHARALAVVATVDLWLARDLPQPVTLSRLPPRAVSLPHRRVIELDGVRQIHLDGDRMVLITDGAREEISRAQVRDQRAGRVSAPFEAVTTQWVLALVDDNPLASFEAHPDKAGNAVSLGGRPVDEWLGSLRQAGDLIADHLSEVRAEMDLFLRQIVPVGHDRHAHLSASYQEAIGTIYLTLHPHVMTMAEALVHEFSHNKLNAALELDPLLTNAFTSTHRSPVRPDPRPLHGVLLAAHAFLPVARMYEQMLDAGAPEASTPTFLHRLEQIVRGNHDAVMVLREKGRPTATGRLLLEEMVRLDTHFISRFPPRSNEPVELD